MCLLALLTLTQANTLIKDRTSKKTNTLFIVVPLPPVDTSLF